MTKLNAATILTKPGTYEPVVLLAGDEIPVWAAPLVGEHLLADEEPAKPARSAKSTAK